MMTLYRLAYVAALLLSAPYWLARMAMQRKYALSLRQRLGAVPERVRETAKRGNIIWLHAVSVGETLAATRLVEELERALPGYTVAISTTTATGQALARQRFGEERVFYFPLDLRFSVHRYLEALRPRLMVLMESELWPCHLEECRRAGVPVVVANTRVSDRSFQRTQPVRRLWQWMTGSIALLLAQSDEDARRLRALGARPEQVDTTGNLKYDIRAGAEMPITTLLRSHLPQGLPLLVAGSTLAGEEEKLIACWKQVQGAAMVLAVRHPERFDGVAALLDQSGLKWMRLSAWRKAPQPIAPGMVLLLDSIGELASVYSLARVAFVGGSLFGAGGHNPLEPAQWSVPVVQGMSYENFRGPVDALRAADAIALVTVDRLCDGISELLFDATHAAAMGRRARDVFEAQAGATARTVSAIVRMMERL
ncbi:3-deoxy-D-manno-octulosonic acid transferase [Terriglobus albidus]|uniref:3-deoxy-D-manno-octulosonic acid transferase n=1 Tax=Terriglobus albidus TaxID=1592106 RepID=UPI0021E054DA|nr:3-deoxy-D-manno-octulosonic acid transferase [Terriglobus albidus]